MARQLIATDSGTHGGPDGVNVYVRSDGGMDVDYTHGGSVVGGQGPSGPGAVSRAMEAASAKTAGRMRGWEGYGTGLARARAAQTAREDAQAGEQARRAGAVAAAEALFGRRGSLDLMWVGDDTLHARLGNYVAVVTRSAGGGWSARPSRAGERVYI